MDTILPIASRKCGNIVAKFMHKRKGLEGESQQTLYLLVELRGIEPLTP